MNSRKPSQPGLSRFFLTFLCGSLLTALPAAAQITIVNDDNTTFTNVVPDTGSPGEHNLEENPWTVSFDAGATADKLIVALSSETGGSGPPVITYNGVALTQVPGTINGRAKGIWYLDNPYTGGEADLVIDMTSYGPVNGIGFGVVSVSGAAPGTTGGAAAAGLEVSVTTAVADSLIVSAYASNSNTLPEVPSGDSQLYASSAIGSASGAAAYRTAFGPAGVQTVTYTQPTVEGNSTAAAAFAPSTIGGLAPITVVNTNGPNGFVQTFPPEINTFSFDAGSTAEMLVVAYASELGGAEPGARVGITYDGYALTRANTGGGFLAEIYYLDLSTTSYTGGAADLVVDLSGYSIRNGLGIGAVSISAGGHPILLHTTADGGTNAQSATLTTTSDETFAVASFNTNNIGGTPAPAVSSPLTQIYASNNIGSARGAAGYETGVSAGDHTYTWTLPDTNPEPRRVVAAAFVAPATGGGDTFADWIATFSGLGGLTAVGDDPDGDGIPNGVENFFGTNPGTFSQGLLAGVKGGNTFTFTHPQNATPASDLTASYQWSKDLSTFLASGATDGAGTTVDFTTQANTPSPGITTVTATVTGTAADKLFVRVNVTQP